MTQLDLDMSQGRTVQQGQFISLQHSVKHRNASWSRPRLKRTAQHLLSHFVCQPRQASPYTPGQKTHWAPCSQTSSDDTQYTDETLWPEEVHDKISREYRKQVAYRVCASMSSPAPLSCRSPSRVRSPQQVYWRQRRLCHSRCRGPGLCSPQASLEKECHSRRIWRRTPLVRTVHNRRITVQQLELIV